MTNRHKHNLACLGIGLLLPIASLLFGACNGQTVFHSFQSLPDRGWQCQDTVDFYVNVPDSFTTYRLQVEIRNNTNYPYQNLPLSLTTYNADTLQVSTDTLQLILANKQGKWTGKGWGGLYQTSIPAGSVSIEKAGTYRFLITYTLPDSLLKGISDVGIRLDRNK